MSWYNTVVLSFSSDEFEDDENESNHDCAALRKINAWLKRHRFQSLSDLNSAKRGKLGSNAVLFGGCYNHLDVEAFIELIGEQTWKHAADVQILFWDDNASKCTLIEVLADRRHRRQSAKRPRARSRATATRRKA